MKRAELNGRKNITICLNLFNPMPKKAMVFGTFDILHPGHVNFFKQARKYGDYLIAVVARDKTVLEVKGKLPVNSERVRKNNILKLKIADKVILGDLKDKYKAIKKIKPDVICLGYDQKAFTEGLKSPLLKGGRGVKKIKIIRLKPFKPEIYKSSKLKIPPLDKGRLGGVGWRHATSPSPSLARRGVINI